MARSQNPKTYLIALTLALLACNRHVASTDSTSISIKAPARMLASLPTGRTICYGLNIVGPSIPATAGGTCAPKYGVTAGFVAAGQDMNATVPANASVDLQLYMYMGPTGSSTCPDIASAFAPSTISNIYLVGSAVNISTGPAGGTTVVDISTNYSGMSVASSFPNSCSGGGSHPPLPFSISSGGGVVSSGTVKLISHSGVVQNTSGTGVKLIVR